MNYFGWNGTVVFYAILYSLIGFGGAFFSLAISKWSAKKFMGVRIIDPRTSDPKERDIVQMVQSISQAARLPKVPEVGIYESNEMNAFATGPSKRNSLVAVSRGLLNSMDEEELRGVLAHEVAHIANGDMVTMTLLQGLLNTMVLFAARLIARVIVSKMRERSFFVEFMIYSALHIVLSLLAFVVLCYFSRKREFRADAGGARYAGSGSMIKALQALQKQVLQPLGKQQAGPAASYNYLKISGVKKSNLMSTHPPLEARIARLERNYI